MPSKTPRFCRFALAALGLLTLASGCLAEPPEGEPTRAPAPADPGPVRFAVDAPDPVVVGKPVAATLPPCQAIGATPSPGTTFVRDPETAHCYMLFPERKTYDEAMTACASYAPRTHLATLNSRAEDELARNMLGASDAWFGYDDIMLEGTFLWNTLEPYRHSNWAAGQPNDPNDGSTEQDCALKSGATGQWDDRDCAATAAYLCERDI